MRRRTLVLVLLGLVLAVPAVALLAFWSLDESYYRQLIARQVEQATGRRLTIEGPLRLRLAPAPTVVVEDVALANPNWAAEANLLELDRLELQLDAMSALVGRLEIDRLALVGPRLALERAPDGRASWTFEADREAAPEPDRTDGEAGTRRDGPARLPVVRELEVRDGELSYRGPGRDEPLRVELPTARLAAAAPEAPVAADLALRIGPSDLQLRGALPPLAGLAGGGPWPIDLALAGDALAGTVKGELGPRTSLEADLQVQEAQALAGLLADAGIVLPVDAAGGGSLAATVTGEGDAWRITGLAARLGESDLSGEAALQLGGERPRLTATLSARQLDLRRPRGAESGTAPGPAAAPGPGDGGGDDAPDHGGLLPRAPLPLDLLAAADATIGLDVGLLRLDGPAVEELGTELALQDGRLSLTPLRLSLGGQVLTGSFAVDAAADPPAWELALAGAAVDPGRLLEAFGLAAPLEGTADLGLELASRGRSPHAMAAALEGQAGLSLAEGRLLPAAFSGRLGELAPLLDAATGGEVGDASELRCLVLAAPVAAGVVRLDLAAMTERAMIVGRGRIDLGAERLDLAFRPQARAGGVEVAVPVAIRGTLRQPQVKLDRGSALRELGQALGRQALPKEALAALPDSMRNTGNPCLEPAPATPTRDADETLDAAKDALRDAGKGLLNDLLRRR